MTGPVVLAIESATSCVGCAVGTVDGVIATAWSTRGRRHAESLAPQISFVMDQAGLAIADIDLVAVDVGPGLYTGLRVGITTARAMAHLLDVAMVPVTSLETIAHANRNGGDMVVAVDARRGEVFHATFTADENGRLVGGAAAVGSAADVVGPAGGRVVGDGGLAHRDAFETAGFVVDADATHLPLPDAILALAIDRIDHAVPAHDIHPCYLRRPDAVAHWGAP